MILYRTDKNRSKGTRERGFVYAFVAILSLPMIAFVGLAISSYLGYTFRLQRQTNAELAALAGVRKLADECLLSVLCSANCSTSTTAGDPYFYCTGTSPCPVCPACASAVSEVNSVLATRRYVAQTGGADQIGGANSANCVFGVPPADPNDASTYGEFNVSVSLADSSIKYRTFLGGLFGTSTIAVPVQATARGKVTGTQPPEVRYWVTH